MDINVLDERLKLVDELFDYVNYGGCGCVANILAKQLRTVFPVMRITTSGYMDEGNIDKVRNVLGNNLNKDEWEENGFYFAHVWVEVYVDDEWYALDSTGVTPVQDMYEEWGVPAEGSFSFDEIEALADTRSGWNTRFDRDQLPQLEFFVANQFDEFVR